MQDAFYLISELVHGNTLAQLLASRALTDEEVLEIGVALADALAHAHSRGVIHRDVKPQNVLVPRRPDQAEPTLDGSVGVAKLTDFGGARLAGEDLLTRTGDVLGTLAYMAPEQSEGHEVGEAADLYALALVLYEALSGVNPVRGSTPAATARRIGRPLAPLDGARGDLPHTLTQALDTALAPSPADRGTLKELRRALEDALEHGLEPSPRRRSTEAAQDRTQEHAIRTRQAAPGHSAAGAAQVRPVAEAAEALPAAGPAQVLPAAGPAQVLPAAGIAGSPEYRSPPREEEAPEELAHPKVQTGCGWGVRWL